MGKRLTHLVEPGLGSQLALIRFVIFQNLY